MTKRNRVLDSATFYQTTGDFWHLKRWLLTGTAMVLTPEECQAVVAWIMGEFKQPNGGAPFSRKYFEALMASLPMKKAEDFVRNRRPGMSKSAAVAEACAKFNVEAETLLNRLRRGKK
jgi:hypothetical protein